MAFMMNKLAMINSCKINLETKIAKNHCETQVCTILVCTLYATKYDKLLKGAFNSVVSGNEEHLKNEGFETKMWKSKLLLLIDYL
jgi:hypothetical protein